MSGTFRRKVKVFVDARLSPAARSASLARVAIEGRDTLIQQKRATPDYDVYVDGVKGAAEASVKPDGVILYQFHQLGQAAVFALGFLIARSPVKSGNYRNSFWLAVDGRPFSQKTFDPQKVGGAEEIIIYNTQPYSRRVQVQMDGNTPLTFSVDPDLFGDTMVACRKKWPRIKATQLARISAPGPNNEGKGPGLYILQGGGRRGNRPVDSPALVLSRRT